MKIYTIIGGVNGTGKSSLTGALRSEKTDLGIIIDVDKLSAVAGSPLEGGKQAVRKIEECIAQGLNFTQETTLSGARTEKTIRQAKEHGYIIRLYYVGLDTLQESIDRIKNRVAKGGHDIPGADVERRFDARFESLKRILPYCDIAVFFDNDNGFAEVAEYKNGALLTKGSYIPHWLRELHDSM